VLHIDNYRHAQGKYRFTPSTGSQPPTAMMQIQVHTSTGSHPAQVHNQHRFTTTNSYDANICSTGSPRCMISPENGILMVAARRMCNIQ